MSGKRGFDALADVLLLDEAMENPQPGRQQPEPQCADDGEPHHAGAEQQRRELQQIETGVEVVGVEVQQEKGKPSYRRSKFGYLRGAVFEEFRTQGCELIN